ncbi:hypothetical protein SAMN06264364_102172 [Quadrisphaera granulorum]|uniref:Homeodomain-like domain-containing protein n=1 Tax=Quadrisphaera granulorum TaxID=317664 RepID=A0A316ADF5_9ACTN|nr:hypothetical protein [Quadrisphaera granulorum]PWJ55806.1 hypothetical protein BXY45_102172 [Quadrisphaera granulorum]SZE95303.1 hypothetical protein SAMN06264364_102172 [Quadrisphaera granulorum]
MGVHDEEVAALAALVSRAGDDDPLQALAALAAARRELETLEMLAVRRARVRSASWAAIAQAMGVTRQAAHQRFRLSRWGDR